VSGARPARAAWEIQGALYSIEQNAEQPSSLD
jgi:hypothetical protein